MKKYIPYILLLILILVSIKPLIFTWNFIWAGYYIHNHSMDAGEYMLKALSQKRSAYAVFNESGPLNIERYIVKTAVIENNPKLLRQYPLEKKFKDSFYFQDLMGNIKQQRRWENLDDVSFALLADPSINNHTLEIIGKISPGIEPGFLSNLADFAWWKTNKQLSSALVSTYSIPDAPFQPSHIVMPSIEASVSIKSIMEFLTSRYHIGRQDIGENLVQCSGFDDSIRVAQNWFFSKMAGMKKFSRGSFIMGEDRVGKNPLMRLMGFFTIEERGKSKPRAGVRYKKNIIAENGYYIFSMDVYIRTGKEIPSVWLAPGLPEERLALTPREWKRVIIVVNNSVNTYRVFQPLVRIWGTGTLLVDNVFLGKVINPRFGIDKPYELTIIPGE